MTGDMKVGGAYSLSEIGRMMGNGAAIVATDRIVTEDLAWQRMTVDRLMLWLVAALEAGEITTETVVVVDSDPEGNGLHPMRAAVALGRIVEGGAGVHPEFEDTTDLPAPAVWFGVGY